MVTQDAIHNAQSNLCEVEPFLNQLRKSNLVKTENEDESSFKGMFFTTVVRFEK